MESTLSGRHILVVDDEMLIAINTKRVLAAAGAIVVGPAPRIPQALELAERAPLDAAVLDINLAGTYVWPLATWLAVRTVPFVFLSGYGPSVAMDDAFRGAPQLDKPVIAGVLVATLAALCDRTSQ